jgi:transcription initiation factor TFIID subunit 5
MTGHAPVSQHAQPHPSGNNNAAAAAASNSPQNLNQIVLEYLSKKGYSRTEAILRKESLNIDANGSPIVSSIMDMGGKRFKIAFETALRWVDNSLEIYKPELQRLLWPLFVYCFLTCMSDYYPEDGQAFFRSFRQMFEAEHEDDVRALSSVYLPEHVQDNKVAKLYQENRYRLSISEMAYRLLIGFLESQNAEGGQIILDVVQSRMDLRSVDRAASGTERSLTKMLTYRDGQIDAPAEDEGIPGHNPGSANLSQNAPAVLSKLSLGPLPMETDLLEDVKAELADLDAAEPPAAGQTSLTEEFEQRIKKEPLDDVPSRDNLPFPPSTARDVAMEVQKIKENRDRFRIEGRTGGVGPGVSVTMFTLHNTFDSVNCIEFSGDNALLAIGTAESYIRLWTLDNQALSSPTDPVDFQPSSSRRLIGHSGPVYALSFSPSIALSDERPTTNGTANGTHASAKNDSRPRFLLSGSADTTIRLWSLQTYTNLVVYRSHSSPVWDVRFSPQGHYFASASADRTARVWCTSSPSPLRLLVGHDSDADCLAWHPNCSYVFTGSSSPDRTVRMWEVVRGTCVRIFTGHTGNITSIACAPNGHTVASADDRGEICVWSIAAGRLVKRMRGHGRGGIWSLDWSVESSVLSSGGADGTVRIWDMRSDLNSITTGKTIAASGEAAAATAAGAKTEAGAAAAITAPTTATSTTGAVKGKSKKDVVVTPDQISAFPTKKSPVYKVRFTEMNLVMAAGAYLP